MLSTERPAPPHTLGLHLSSPRRTHYTRSFSARYNRHQEYRGFPEVLSNPPSPSPQPVYPTQQPIRLTGSLGSILKDEKEDKESEFVLPRTPDKSIPVDLGELRRSGEKKIYEKYFKVLSLSLSILQKGTC